MSAVIIQFPQAPAREIARFRKSVRAALASQPTDAFLHGLMDEIEALTARERWLADCDLS